MTIALVTGRYNDLNNWSVNDNLLLLLERISPSWLSKSTLVMVLMKVMSPTGRKPLCLVGVSHFDDWRMERLLRFEENEINIGWK